jgi:protein O-mannosyl-transferase
MACSAIRLISWSSLRIVVFFFARRLGVEYWTGALASLIFAVHPVHIECVAWISAASGTMVTIFFMMAFMAFIRSRDDRKLRWLAWRVGSVVLLACALLTKEMGPTFSGLVALYEWLFPSPRERRRLQKLRQCFLVALPYGIVTLGYQVSAISRLL